MTRPLISVVTPAYNEEEYLAECIESVLAQTYQDWDYTIVNNCSTDRTLEIARRYAAKDRRIRVYDNERFLPMLANHNVAARQITSGSKYCKVVLADDWMYPDCLEKMVAVAEANPSVGVVSAYERCGEQIRLTGLPKEVTVVDGRQACRQFLLGTLLLFGAQTSVLYRADFVRNRDPFYVETDNYADFEVCFAILRTADLGFVHKILTFSRPRATSMGAISADIGTHFRSVLGLLLNYGMECLSDDEFAKCLADKVSQYYTFLGRRLWVERDKHFWAFHSATLAEAGLGLSKTRLAKAGLAQLCSTLLDPKRATQRIKPLFSLTKVRSQEMRSQVLAQAEATSLEQGRKKSGREDVPELKQTALRR
jgi:glycosyltransferase involved in cell wall biosynthesis